MLGLRQLASRAARVGLTHSNRMFSLPAHELVNMPALSPTMQTGTIGKWLFKVGDTVKPGQAVAEIETDKASMAFEAQDEMIIAKFLAAEGEEVRVGVPILVTVDKVQDVGAFASFAAPKGASNAVVAPKAPAAAASAPPKASAAPSAAAASASASASASAPKRAVGDRVVASPLARKLARDAKIDLASIVGTGPGGRIIAADVKSAPIGSAAAAKAVSTSGSASHATQSKVTTSFGSSGVYSDFELSDLALGVASRYTQAKRDVPHYFVSVDLDLTKLLQLRRDLGDNMDTTSFFVKAAASAMKEVPDVNGAWMESFVRRYEQVDINLIMGAGAGLITPVIRDVGAKGLKALSSELAALEDELFSDSDGKQVSSTAELAPGTFSIHDLGMFGIKSATPIVLPPQSCALALGAIVDTVVPHATTKWAVAPVMTATLSVDHRVVDGAVAAQWLSAFKVLVENPVALML